MNSPPLFWGIPELFTYKHMNIFNNLPLLSSQFSLVWGLSTLPTLQKNFALYITICIEYPSSEALKIPIACWQLTTWSCVCGKRRGSMTEWAVMVIFRYYIRNVDWLLNALFHFLTVMRYNSHTIQFVYLKCTI